MKKYRVWVFLGITLLLAYFSPPLEMTVTHERSNDVDSNIRAALSNKTKSGKPNRQIEVLDLLARVDRVDRMGKMTLSIFSKPYVPPVPVDIPQKNKDDNTSIEKMRVEAPPIPFQWLGRYIDSDGEVVFVKHKEKNLVLQVGDVFLGKYQLEAVEPQSLTFVYLPMNIKQTLNLANMNYNNH